MDGVQVSADTPPHSSSAQLSFKVLLVCNNYLLFTDGCIMSSQISTMYHAIFQHQISSINSAVCGLRSLCDFVLVFSLVVLVPVYQV